MNIPMQSLARHVAQSRAAVNERLAAVLDRAHFILGPEVKEFERRFAEYIGTKYCIAVANGTQAMELALRALESNEGEVLTTANAGMYSSCAILSAGFTPIYAEIDPVLMTPEPESVALAITPQTRALMVTHLYGQMADMRHLSEIAHASGLPLIEDCAEAHGAIYDGKKAGSFGLAGCFSFYPTKNLGAYGDGGAITTNDEAYAARLRSLRQYGWTQKYHADMPHGANSRMDEMQAGILNAKLDHLDRMNARRRNIAEHYNGVLTGKAEQLPFTTNNNFIVHHYVLRSSNRREVMDLLGEEGIATDVHFPVPDYRQKALAARYDSIRLPATERACEEVFTIPSFPELTDSEVSFVAASLAKHYRP